MSLLGGTTFEYAVEMTYPLPESISAGLLSLSNQVIPCLLKIVYSNSILYPSNFSFLKVYNCVAIFSIDYGYIDGHHSGPVSSA